LASKVIRAVDSVIERAGNIGLVVSGFILFIMVLLATYGVVRRYIFDSPEPYSYELSMVGMLWSFVLAVAALERQRRHIRVDFVSGRLPLKAQNILLDIVAPTLGLFFCFLLAWQGWEVALFSLSIGEVSSSAWAIPLFPVKVVVPIGFALLCLALLTILIRGVASLFVGTKKVVE
jgi:TRAP-type C4-dicarboxylate transport system permease small subunit